MRNIRSSHSSRTAFTRLEVVIVLIACGVLLVLVSSALLPNLSDRGCRELSNRLVCGSNVKGIGTSCKIYANDNYGSWSTPAFDESFVGKIDYRVPVGGGAGTVHSPNRAQPSISCPDGTKELTVSRAYWMLVRSGDITVKQFICPQSSDTEDPTRKLDQYYDFSDYKNLSYGFQVPFGRPDTRAREGADNKLIFAADKGPYRDATIATPPSGFYSVPHEGSYSDLSKKWSPYQSSNHQGEGQNMLFADGHASFQRTPIAGADEDNIYTIALDNWSLNSRVEGESPWLRASPPSSSTDSVIFP